MTPDDPQLQHEFFSAAANVAGTFWAVLAVSFPLFVNNVQRSGVVLRVHAGSVAMLVAPVMVAISDLFLCSMFSALGHLLPGSQGPTWATRVGFFSLIAAFAVVVLFEVRVFGGDKLPRVSFGGADIKFLVGIYFVSAFLIIGTIVGADYFSAVTYVVVTMATGCLAFLAVGMVSLSLGIIGITTKQRTPEGGEEG